MDSYRKGTLALISSCAAIFWPGAFIFGFPGVMAGHWQETFQVGRGAVGQSLFFVLLGVGMFMYLTGRLQERVGPSRLFALGTILCGASAVLVGHAPNMGFVYFCTLLFGIASAFVYIPGLTVVQRWYPQRRGLVSGLVNMVFGLSAAVMSPIFTAMLKNMGTASMTLILGILALITGLTAAGLVRMPDSPPPAFPPGKGAGPVQGLSLTVPESLRTRAFWFLWFTWALAGAAGIAMVTLSTSFGTAKGLPMQQAVAILIAFNLTNGLGRLASGHLSDVLGRNITMTLAFGAAGCSYLLLDHVDGVVIWVVLSAFVGFAFGTLFAVSAPLATDCFGMAHFGAVFGLVFTAYGFVSGPLGPWLGGYLLDATGGNFTVVFSYLGVFCLASAILIWFVRPTGGVKSDES
ncbi:MAG: MFS transporter [Deltaproteobacteria bacterium]|nr:MFS transporter [Deltaproteobacteria bacterium]